MSKKTCFLILATSTPGQQEAPSVQVERQHQHNQQIHEAIHKAQPALTIIRSDQIAPPGAITPELIQQIIHADYVVADLSYPDPVAFYLLGSRHAYRAGTLLIKEKSTPNIPFDLSPYSPIPYENTASGLEALCRQLKQGFEQCNTHPDAPDSPLLQHIQHTQEDMEQELGICFSDSEKLTQLARHKPELRTRLEAGEDPFIVLQAMSETDPDIEEALPDIMAELFMSPLLKLKFD